MTVLPNPPWDEASNAAQAFASIAAQYPDAPALVWEQSQLSYAELAERCARIAGAILASAEDRSGPVALLPDTGLDAVLSMLACVLAGKTYVPLDPAWPLERRSMLLNELEPAVLLASREANPLDATAAPRLLIAEAEAFGKPAPVSEARADTPLAGYFTSGSTGRAKLVVIDHACMLHAQRNHIDGMLLTPADRLLWVSPPSVGAAMMSVFATLLSGACLHRFELANGSMSALLGYLAWREITVLHCATSLFRALLHVSGARAKLAGLRQIKVGGEPMYAADLRRAAQVLPETCALLNGLGITEAGGNVTLYQCPRANLDGIDGPVPVGRPLPGFEVRILNEAGDELPPGELGEIQVRGAYLALGYLGQPDLTAKAFAREDGLRTYLTGDQGWLDSSGVVTHAGRTEQRLLIKGFTIDAGEVESVLLSHESVAAAAVCERWAGGQARMVAFIQRRRGAAGQQSTLRRFLIERLPTHMQPWRVLQVDILPKLASGKLNRAALQELSLTANTRTASVVADRLEAQLLALWQRVLGQDDIGPDEDFFERGGDSLAAARLFAEIDRLFGVDLALPTLASAATVRRLAERVREGGPDQSAAPAVLLFQGIDGAQPVFCVPGAGSDVLAIRDLANSLGEEVTCYGLQYPGVDPGSTPLSTMPELVQVFVAAVRRVQPRGPYFLVGASFGGAVALEMARVLQQQGDRIGLLAMLDTYGPGYPRIRLRGPGCVIQTAVRWMLPLGRKHEVSLSNLWQGIVDRLRRLRARAHYRLHPARPWPGRNRHVFQQEACMAAWHRVEVEPYQGDLLLFRAEHPEMGKCLPFDESLGWSPFIMGELALRDCPGQHGAHVKPPHVFVLAARLRVELEAALASTGPERDRHQQGNRRLWEDLAGWWGDYVKSERVEARRDQSLPILEAWLGDPDGCHLLELGCGTGWLARRFAARGARVTATDISSSLLAKAAAETAADDGVIEYLELDVCRPEQWSRLASASFDGAMSAMAMADFPGIEELFAELARVMRPGARFVFSLPQPSAGDTGVSMIDGGSFAYHLDAEQPRPLIFYPYTRADVLEQAERHGLLLRDWRQFLVGSDRVAVGCCVKLAASSRQSPP